MGQSAAVSVPVAGVGRGFPGVRDALGHGRGRAGRAGLAGVPGAPQRRKRSNKPEPANVGELTRGNYEDSRCHRDRHLSRLRRLRVPRPVRPPRRNPASPAKISAVPDGKRAKISSAPGATCSASYARPARSFAAKCATPTATSATNSTAGKPRDSRSLGSDPETRYPVKFVWPGNRQRFRVKHDPETESPQGEGRRHHAGRDRDGLRAGGGRPHRPGTVRAPRSGARLDPVQIRIFARRGQRHPGLQPVGQRRPSWMCTSIRARWCRDLCATDLLRAMARANPETSAEMRDQDRLPLEEFQSLRSSIVWDVQQVLLAPPAGLGSSHRQGLRTRRCPAASSDGHHPQAIADERRRISGLLCATWRPRTSFRRRFTSARNRRGHRIALAACGSTSFASSISSAAPTTIPSSASCWAIIRWTRWISPSPPCKEHIDQCSFIVLDAMNPLKTLSFLRHKILQVHLDQRVRQPARRRSGPPRRQVCTSCRCAPTSRWPT